MKITKQQLKEMIKEAVEQELSEQRYMSRTSPIEVSKNIQAISQQVARAMQGVSDERIIDNLARMVEQFGEDVSKLISWVEKNK